MKDLLDNCIIAFDEIRANKVKLTLSSIGYIISVGIINGLVLYFENLGLTNSIFILIVLIISIPIILATFFLIGYSLSIFDKTKQYRLLTLYSKGITRTQLILINFFEDFVRIAIGTVIGNILAIGLGVTILKSDSFFSFNRIIANVQIKIFDLFFVSIIFTVLITIIFDYNKVKFLLNTTINTIERQISEERKEFDQWWKKNNIDIFLVFLSTLPIFLIILFENVGFPIPEQIINPFFLFSPLILLIGGLMLVSRVFTFFVSNFSVLMWKHGRNSLAFSLKIISRSRQKISQIFIVLSLSIATILLMFTIGETIISDLSINAKYNIGSDIVVTMNSSSDNSTDYCNEFLVLSNDISSCTNVKTNQFFNGFLMVIDTSTFIQTAWFPDNVQNNLQQAIAKLSNINNSILVFDKNIPILNFINDSTMFIWPGQSLTSEISLINFTLVDTFSNLPRIVKSDSSLDFLYGIIDIKTYENLQMYFPDLQQNYPNYDFMFQNLIYLKLKSNTNIEKLISSINVNFPLIQNIESPALNIKEELQSDSMKLAYGVFNLTLLIFTLILYIFLILFGINEILNRGKEISLERILGASNFEIFKIQLFAMYWLLFMTVIIGLFFASFYSLSLKISLEFLNHIPPISIVIPWNLFLGFSLFLITTGGIFSIFPLIHLFKVDINYYLRKE